MFIKLFLLFVCLRSVRAELAEDRSGKLTIDYITSVCALQAFFIKNISRSVLRKTPLFFFPVRIKGFFLDILSKK